LTTSSTEADGTDEDAGDGRLLLDVLRVRRRRCTTDDVDPGYTHGYGPGTNNVALMAYQSAREEKTTGATR
jgi:hypothetical protein